MFSEEDKSHSNFEESDNAHKEPPLVQYPENLNLKDLFYFILAPTLCYELNFPRTSRVRKRFLIKRIMEVALGSQIILVVMQQYMIPSVKNSLIPFSNMDVTLATERLLKLAVSLAEVLFMVGFFLFVTFSDSKSLALAVFVLYYVPFFPEFSWRTAAVRR